MTPEQYERADQIMSQIAVHEEAIGRWEEIETPGESLPREVAKVAPLDVWKTFRRACIDHSHREIERLKQELAAL